MENGLREREAWAAGVDEDNGYEEEEVENESVQRGFLGQD